MRQERRVALRELPQAIDPRRASIHRVRPEIGPEIGLLLGRPARAAPGEGRLPQRFGQRHSFPISYRLPGSGPGRGAQVFGKALVAEAIDGLIPLTAFHHPTAGLAEKPKHIFPAIGGAGGR